MTCPYCKKEVTMSAGFCPECGLSISKKCDTENLKTYWNRINSAREKYLLEKEKIILNEKKEKNIRITKADGFMLSAFSLQKNGGFYPPFFIIT